MARVSRSSQACPLCSDTMAKTQPIDVPSCASRCPCNTAAPDRFEDRAAQSPEVARQTRTASDAEPFLFAMDSDDLDLSQGAQPGASDGACELDSACPGMRGLLQRLSCRSDDAKELELWRAVDSITSEWHCPSLAGSKDKAEACTVLASQLVERGFSATTVATSPSPEECGLYRNPLPHNFLVVHLGPEAAAAAVAVGEKAQKSRPFVVVDIHFRSQFIVARPSAKFCRCMDLLPEVFLGRLPLLAEAVSEMGEHIAESFAKAGMPLPPWRRTRALLSCWFRHPGGLQPAAPRMWCNYPLHLGALTSRMDGLWLCILKAW
mmetsp:Transcript_812/g.2913  ORF Transcript_812/g.2913 Transcript_812/m.2913 type:complete len:321 (+) Transcript_812:160-1122(+)